ncbi:NALCN channel auxiliary factor 1 [Callospermophilus lateralis]|uniref:NALCN channel auxiliary factor 1 n=1 Tax=Callospermophilus lateralis TaxID=76772 RepID=UPI004038D997
MTRGAWMCRQYDDGLKIWLAAPRENEKPFIDSERAQKWRLSLASLLFFTVLLSDHLWFCAEAKLTRTRDKEHHQQQQQQRQQQQQQQQQRQRQQQQQQQQRQRQQEPSWPALLASMGESSPAAQAHRLLSASSSPTLPPSPGGGGGGGGKGNRGKNNRSKALFLGNSARPVWRLETCYPQGASSGQCFTVESADAVCARNWSRGAAARGEEQQARGEHPTPLWNLSDFYLSFCNSYTLWELFSGLSSPNTLNCSLDVVLTEGGERTTCRQCVAAYQDYDHHAQEKYEEFESVLHKYLQSEEYSVKSCPEDCKIVYKAWLCSQYFEVTQFNCRKTIPCKQYCLEVQTRCPFILPDNDEVIYGGLSSFICTGLYETFLTSDEPECCDVRRGEQSDLPRRGRPQRSDACHRTSLTVSSATRLCSGRLKLCVLVLILLHTVLTASAAHNAAGLGLGGITSLEENATNED